MKTGRARWDQLLLNCRVVNALADGSGYSTIESGAIGIAGHQIVFVGTQDALPVAAPLAEVRAGRGATLKPLVSLRLLARLRARSFSRRRLMR